MCFGAPKIPKPEKLPPAAKLPDLNASLASKKKKRAPGIGGNTILTSARGVTSAGSTANKTLLGQ